MPPEQNDDGISQNIFSKLPPHGVFVGRTWELACLKNFLSDQAPNARRIMLVYGPRGVGKSALVREAAQQGIDDSLVNTAVWLDRTRATEILSLDEDHLFPLPEGDNKFDPKKLIEVDDGKYAHQFITPKQGDGDQLSPAAVDFLKELLKNEPFLLIIDDFDEYDGLGDDPHLCEQIARVRPPNKVILTTRRLKHNFPQQVFKTLEVGLLEENEVKRLVEQCCFDHLEPTRLINGNVAATVDYFWQISGGLSEFIIRFLVPLVEQREWLFEDPRWSEAFACFSASYFIEREQERSFERYEVKSTDNLARFREKFQACSNDEQYILLALADQEEVQALDEKDLAHALGYRVEDRHLFIQFHDALHRLHQKRLISRRLEGRIKESWDKEPSHTALPRTWLLLPFARGFIKNQVLNTPEAETSFRQKQADRWMDFVEGYRASPKRVKPQLDKIYIIFSWCLANQEWQRLVRLGKNLSGIMWELGWQQNPQQKDWFVKICLETVTAAQQPNIDAWQVAVKQWLLLAQLYLESGADRVSQQLALNYAEMAVQYIEHRGESAVDVWVEALSLLARIYLQIDHLVRCQECLEKIAANEQGNFPEWIELAYQLAGQHLRTNANQAQFWLERVVDVAEAQKDFIMAARAGVDLVQICLRKKDGEQQAITLLERAKEALEKTSSTKEVSEVQIKILTIEAQIAYYADEIEKCQVLLKEARSLAKEIAQHPIAEELNVWLNFILFSTREFDPTSKIDRLLGGRLLWGTIEDGQICLVCHQELAWDDLFEEKLWLCPNCKNHIHLDCLQITDNHCPSCRELRVIYT